MCIDFKGISEQNQKHTVIFVAYLLGLFEYFLELTVQVRHRRQEAKSAQAHR